MNGIDLLFVAIGFVLLFIITEAWDRYSDWFEWDRDCRRQRKLNRLEYQEKIAEKEYRRYLRINFKILTFSRTFSHSLTPAVKQATRSIEKFGEILRGETRV